MKYQVVIKQSAQKEIRVLPKSVMGRVVSKIKALAEEPRPSGAKKLVGSDQTWRIRIGDYRVVYEIVDEVVTVTIVAVRYRKDAYS